MNPHLCRAARGLLNWSQDKLAETAMVSKNTISSYERGATKATLNNINAMQRALEGAGIVFLGPSWDGDILFIGGVQLKIQDAHYQYINGTAFEIGPDIEPPDILDEEPDVKT